MAAQYLVFNRVRDDGCECATLKDVEQYAMEQIAEGEDVDDLIVYENPKAISMGFCLVTHSE